MLNTRRLSISKKFSSFFIFCCFSNLNSASMSSEKFLRRSPKDMSLNSEKTINSSKIKENGKTQFQPHLSWSQRVLPGEVCNRMIITLIYAN